VQNITSCKYNVVKVTYYTVYVIHTNCVLYEAISPCILAGKTQLSHTLAVSTQLPGINGYSGGKVIYLDTENTFRPDRLRPIADRFKVDQEAVLDNVLYARAYTSEQQMELLDYVAAKCNEEPGKEKNISCLYHCVLYTTD